MYNSKKAQISDTLSWGVATIIIVLILSIPILLIQFKMINVNKISFSRMDDPIATKSISGYFLGNYAKIIKPNLEEKEPSSELKDSLNLFLATLPRDKKEQWVADILINDNPFYEKKSSGLVSYIHKENKRARNAFYFEEKIGKVIINFWMESERGLLDNP